MKNKFIIQCNYRTIWAHYDIKWETTKEELLVWIAENQLSNSNFVALFIIKPKEHQKK